MSGVMLPLKSASEALRPDPILSVSEWADEYRHLTSKETPEPGPWRTSRVPYMKEIQDALSVTSPVTDVCFMKSAQVGGTEAGNNWIGYVIHHSPGPMLAVQPTVDVAQRVSKQRVAPLIQNSPVLAERIKPPRTPDASNTILAKEFPGGMLLMAGANSAAGLRSMPIRYLFLDEIDAYPADVDGEGDPVALAEQRTQNFRRRKRFKVSTPTTKGFSRIEEEYEESDKRKYWIPCPHCGEFQVLEWKNVEWPTGKPADAMYLCEHCGCLWDDSERAAAVTRGEWRPEHSERKKRGYHIWAAYSPWVRLGELAEEFLVAKGHPERLKTFINTKLGQTWEEEGERVNADSLAGRRESYRAQVPDGVGILVASVDTQGDRLEVKVKGYGKGEESWVIHAEQLWGDPGRDSGQDVDKDGVPIPNVWQQLEELRTRAWKHESGADLRIQAMCIDSGGHHTENVYRYVKPRQGQRVWATKGMSQPGRPLVGRPSRANKHGVKLLPIGTDTAKDAVFARLKVNVPGPLYMHFPEFLDDEYFAQLTSEKVVTRYVKGRPVRSYEKTRPRNEALDLEVLCLAALLSLGTPTLKNLGNMVDSVRAEGARLRDEEPAPKAEASRRSVPSRRRGWVSGWR